MISKSIAVRFGTIMVGAFLLCLTAANAAVIEQITNGDFETGTLAGWTTSNVPGSLAPQINDGTVNPSNLTGAQAPIGGNFDAFYDQFGPGNASLSQQVVLPTSGITHATVSWDDRIVSENSFPFVAGQQQFQVVIRDITSTILSTLFITNPGDPISQIGPNARSFDITTLVQGLAGQTVTLGFETIVNNQWMPVWVDNVSFVTTVPEPGILAIFGLGLAGLGYMRRKRTI